MATTRGGADPHQDDRGVPQLVWRGDRDHSSEHTRRQAFFFIEFNFPIQRGKPGVDLNSNIKILCMAILLGNQLNNILCSKHASL